MKNKIIVGTRGSNLALYQANKVKSEINHLFPEITVEIKIIKTKGDKILDVALSKIGDKGLFTKELEIALINGQVDICVHSLKDLATDLPEGLKLGAVLKRGEYRDALVHKDGKTLSELSSEDTIATSSLRRIAGLRKIKPEVQIVDIRGNVQTRLKKMEEGHCDGMLMAAAGLQRLDLENYITEIIEPEQIIPAVSQGAIAIESRINDAEVDEILKVLNHVLTLHPVLGEREFLNKLQGGCQVPVGCYSSIEGENLTIKGFVASLDGSKYLTDHVTGNISDSIRLGDELAAKLITLGGKEILDEIRNSLPDSN
jgi:hydroxymethylbilane synthase